MMTMKDDDDDNDHRSTTTTTSRNNGVHRREEIGENDDYYDDDEDENNPDSKMYKEACSITRFMVNPCFCLFDSTVQCYHVVHNTIIEKRTNQQRIQHRRQRQRRRRQDKRKTSSSTTTAVVVSPTILVFVRIMMVVFGILMCIQMYVHVIISSSSSSSSDSSSSSLESNQQQQEQQSLSMSVSKTMNSFKQWLDTPRKSDGRIHPTRNRRRTTTTSTNDQQNVVMMMSSIDREDELYGYQITLPIFDSSSSYGARGRIAQQQQQQQDIGGWTFQRHFMMPDIHDNTIPTINRFDSNLQQNVIGHEEVDHDDESSDNNNADKPNEKKNGHANDKKKKKNNHKDDDDLLFTDDDHENEFIPTGLRLRIEQRKKIAQPDYGGLQFKSLFAKDNNTDNSGGGGGNNNKQHDNQNNIHPSNKADDDQHTRRRREIDELNMLDLTDALTDEEQKDIDDRNHGLDDEIWVPDDIYLEHAEDIEDFTQECYRPSFKNIYRPTCNTVHELDMGRDYKPLSQNENGEEDDDFSNIINDQVYDTYYINHGYFRDVWVVQQPDFDLRTVLKTIRWKHKIGRDMTREVNQDASIMERMTGSPRIVDIYGHCNTAVWVEAINYEVEEVIIHGEGYYDLGIDKKRMSKEEQDRIRLEFPMVEDLTTESGEVKTVPKSFNDFTALEKLDIALQMAMSLADLHGYVGGLIVHDDVQLCQWLRTKDGQIKLGDFNRAEIMDYSPTKQQYCKYNNGHGHGNYRSPEEFAGDDIDEKIDVYSFGNNIYGLLTGLWVFYEDDDDHSVQDKISKGQRAAIDPRWRDRSVIESRLIDIMIQCWEQDPNKRIEIFDVVRQLETLWDETRHHHSANNNNNIKDWISDEQKQKPTSSGDDESDDEDDLDEEDDKEDQVEAK